MTTMSDTEILEQVDIALAHLANRGDALASKNRMGLPEILMIAAGNPVLRNEINERVKVALTRESAAGDAPVAEAEEHTRD